MTGQGHAYPLRGPVALVLLLMLTGCTNGILTGTLAGDLSNANQSRGSFNGTFLGGIYSHTVEPVTFNTAPTEMTDTGKEAKGRIHQFEYPMTMVSVRLGRNGLGDVARQHGIETIYFADIEHWSAVFGIWSADVVHIYGH